MLFSHSPQLLDQFPQLAVTALSVTGITAAPDVADTTRPFLERATARLVQRPESEFPRSPVATRIQPDGPETHPIPVASEALLRRFRKDGLLPSIHPLSTCATPSPSPTRFPSPWPTVAPSSAH
jgi:hypothetical protein